MWDIGEQVWRAAGSRYGSYARDRRRQCGHPGPSRTLADFQVGAHALYLGGRILLTIDKNILTNYFPELRIVASEKDG